MNVIEPEDHASEVREPAGYRHADADIARALRECLDDDVGLDSRGIEVEVRNGEVTLSGRRRSRCPARHRKSVPARPRRWASPATRGESRHLRSG